MRTYEYKDVVSVWRKEDPKPPSIQEWVTMREAVYKMERKAVSSSTIGSIGYDAKTLTLEIEFINGTIYQYFDIAESVHTEFVSSASHGQFFNTQIKGHYRYAKL